MVFRIFFKYPRSLNVFPVSLISSRKGSTLSPRELERDAGTVFQHPGAQV